MVPLLDVQILLHYCTADGRFEDLPLAPKSNLEHLVQQNMLECVSKDSGIQPSHRITARGKFYVEHLLNVPFPKDRVTFVIERPIEALKKVLS